LSFNINTSLTLQEDVAIPLTMTAPTLTFYSRYHNDANDYGFVEISTDGGSNWVLLQALEQATKSPPATPEMRKHLFDLSAYIGQAIRLRFRYDNGIASIPPDSNGWYLDDITIYGGVWKTVGYPISDNLIVAGHSFGNPHYRVRSLYQDGSVSVWSDVVGMEIVVLPAISPTVTISAANTSAVNLSWTSHIPNNCSYEIHVSEQPYFVVNAGTFVTTTTQTTTQLPMTTGNPTTNHYIIVRAVNCNATSVADSNRVGEFDFAVVAGTP
jgi:hypothetical protein